MSSPGSPEDEPDAGVLVPSPEQSRVPAANADDDLPVVARMVVEIRSDGRRTIARGALEDPDGQRVTVEARSTSPWALARELAGALWKMPRLPRPSLRSMLPGRRRRRDDDDR